MKREEIIEQLSMESGFSRQECDIFYDSFVEIIRNAILDGEGKILIKGLMTITQKEIPERDGRNPKTGEVCVFPPSLRLNCKMSEDLKDRINGRK